MKYRPGRKLVQASVAVAATTPLTFVWPGWLAVVLVAGVVLALLAWRDAHAAAVAVQKLVARRAGPLVIGRDRVFPAILTLTSDYPSELRGEVRDVLPDDCREPWVEEPFTILPGSQVEFSTPCRIPIRGLHRFGPVAVWLEGPAGLMEAQRLLEAPRQIRVLPETFASREEFEKDVGAQILLLDKILRSRQQGFGTEFVSLAHYREGDDPRLIDWKSTARMRTPIVRRHQIERHRDVLIVIDKGRQMGSIADRGTKLDCAVDAALNLARVALQTGDRCGVAVFDSELRGYLAPLTGTQSLGRVVDSVYDLRTDWKESDFSRLFAELSRRQQKRSLLVILSDLGDEETSRGHRAALARLGQRHLVLFAALKTPQLARVIHRPITTVEEGAEQAVALGLRRDRGRSLHSLRHAGVHVLDVEPRDLTVPLVNQFIQLRQHNEL